MTIDRWANRHLELEPFSLSSLRQLHEKLPLCHTAALVEFTIDKTQQQPT